MLDATPAERRATPAEEREMIRWAGHGVTRVAHVLNAANTRVLTFRELCTHHPNLVSRGATRDRVRRMFDGITANLRGWHRTLAAGPRPEVQRDQFRHTRTGQLLRARQAARPGDTTVPAPGSAKQNHKLAPYGSPTRRPHSPQTPRRASSAR